MAEQGTAELEEVEQEGAISLEGAIEIADTAIANIKPEMQAGEVFPGSRAYNSVMRAVVMAGENSNKVIANWQEGYEELIDKFDGTDPEGFAVEVKTMLEGFLADTKEKLGQGVEKGQAE